MINSFSGKKILVTGGSGSIGSEIVKQLIDLDAKVVRVFSRDETRQAELANNLCCSERVRFLIGDVRDKDRLKRALESIDIVFHAAALKHVPICEYNPFEAVQTNVIGTQNILTASRESGVKQVVLISTDKAVSPTNTMGATKLLAERLISGAHRSMSGMVICGVRFGNVLGSRGSLLPLLRKEISSKRCVTITDRAMTRFFMTINQAVELLLRAAELAEGGEIFVLPMPKIRIIDLIKVVIDEECVSRDWDPKTIEIQEIGKRPGEKLHEHLLTVEECERAYYRDEIVVVNHLEREVNVDFNGLQMDLFDSESGPFLSKEEILKLLNLKWSTQKVHG